MSSINPADFYTGLVAEAYQVLRGHSFDPARYAAFVRTHGEPGLEVGCGQGEPVLDLAAEGLDVDGIDSSPDMIELARRHAADRGLDVGLEVALMQDMDLDRQYRSIYLAGPTFELLDDDETCLAALQAFRRHLHPDGTVLVPLWIPDRTSADDLGVARESVDDAGTTLRYTPLSEQYDPASRTRRTEVRYERIQSDGTAESVEKQWIIHWQTLESMTALAAEAGLAVSSVDPAASELTGQPGEEFAVTLTHDS